MRALPLLLILSLGITGCGSRRDSPAPGPVDGTIHGGGGGDPLANDFTRIVDLLVRAQAAGRIDLGVSNEILVRKVDGLKQSLEERNPLVRFVSGPTLDCFGAPKLGCVDDRGIIRFARAGWQQADAATRLEVTVMEIVKSLGGTSRYSIADTVTRTLAWQKTLGPTEFLGVDSGLDPSDQPILTPNGLRLIDRALFLASTRKRIPQFDLDVRDAFPSFKSSERYEATADSPDVCRRQSWRRSVAVSAVDKLDPIRRAGVFVVEETFEKCPGKGLKSRMTDTIYAPETWDLDQIPRGNVSSDPYDAVAQDRPLRAFRPSPESHPLFRACEALALNEAIARAATDARFDKFVQLPADGWRERKYSLLTFLGSGNRLDANTKYLITLMVMYDGFKLPYTYLIATRAVGDGCRITGIRSGAG